MRGKKKVEAVQTEATEQLSGTEPEVKRRGGRKPMSESEKAAQAKQRAEAKAKAANMVPSIVLQYQGTDTELDALVEAVKADFKSQKKRTPITELKLYLKPEDNAAYYVVNGEFNGMVSL